MLTVGGVSYVRGIGAHAPGDLTVNLGGGCERFTAVAGVDAEVSSATARVAFTVLADGVTLYTSPPVTLASGPAVIDLDVTGRSALRLVLGDGGNGIDFDHADWADARLLC